MLRTSSAPALADASSEAAWRRLRATEFARLDQCGLAYLDYTGAALPPDSLLHAHLELIARDVFGNPHSEHAPSRRSAECMDAARDAVLTFFDADPLVYDVCFTANATTAARLVTEAFPFDAARGLLLTADNHNSLNGAREIARRRGAPVRYIALDDDLRLCDPRAALEAASREMRGGLFGFPAQSNFSGVQHELGLVDAAHAAGFTVLLDAAAYAPTNPLSLRRIAPDFVVLSFYKMFGYPTGIGALIATHAALARLRRPSFSGGTVDFVSVQNDMYQLTTGARGFEDGTPNFLAIPAVPLGLEFLRDLGVERIHKRVTDLAASLIAGFSSLRHANGRPVVQLYGSESMTQRGGTVAFNVLATDGRPVSYAAVEARARDASVAMRGGCFCNPGCAEAAFGFDAARSREAMVAAAREGFTIERFAAHMGGDVPVGAMRASVGIATDARDVERAIEVVGSFAD